MITLKFFFLNKFIVNGEISRMEIRAPWFFFIHDNP